MPSKISCKSGKCRWEALGVGLIKLAVFYTAIETSVRITLVRLAGFDNSLYTWGGAHFGRRVKKMLITSGGVEVGYFDGDEIFGADGIYLGELKAGRLVTHMAKKSKRGSGFRPQLRKSRRELSAQAARLPYAGFEDFPHPDTFLQSVRASVA